MNDCSYHGLFIRVILYMIIGKCLKFRSHAQLILTAAVDQFSMISVFEINILFSSKESELQLELNYPPSGW